MRISDVSTPEIYRSSADFRFFLKWFEEALTKVHYDTENLLDLYDSLKCPDWLLWMLADTMGFKYDDRLPTAFNRFVLLYFMSMIRNRGSKDGVTLAAEANLKQFDIETVAGVGYQDDEGEFVAPKEILFNRLEDTSIPVNSAYVTPHTPEGYIDVVYFSDRLPIDACIEYVRPLGMYLFQSAGVRMDARTKISVDARLTNSNNIGMSIGPTHVGHYSRDDYARMQRFSADVDEAWDDLAPGSTDGVRNKLHIRDAITQRWQYDSEGNRTERESVDPLHDTRNLAWYRNSAYESEHGGPSINAGYRALYSLQLCNNEHIVQSLIPRNPNQPEDGMKNRPRIFGLGWEPQDVEVEWPDDFEITYDLENRYYDPGTGKFKSFAKNQLHAYNLQYDKEEEEKAGKEVWTVEEGWGGTDPAKVGIAVVGVSLVGDPGSGGRTSYPTNPYPAVNPIMSIPGDAISETEDNTMYIMSDSDNYPMDRDTAKNYKPEDEIERGEIAAENIRRKRDEENQSDDEG